MKSSLLGHSTLSYRFPDCISAGRSCSDILRVNNKKIDLICLDNFRFAGNRGCVRSGMTASFSKQRLPNDRQYLIEKEIVLI